MHSLYRSKNPQINSLNMYSSFFHHCTVHLLFEFCTHISSLVQTEVVCMIINICIFAAVCLHIEIKHGRSFYNRRAENSYYPVNTRASFTCDSGSSLTGSGSRICQSSGDWSGEETRCEGNVNFMCP